MKRALVALLALVFFQKAGAITQDDIKNMTLGQFAAFYAVSKLTPTDIEQLFIAVDNPLPPNTTIRAPYNSALVTFDVNALAGGESGGVRDWLYTPKQLVPLNDRYLDDKFKLYPDIPDSMSMPDVAPNSPVPVTQCRTAGGKQVFLFGKWLYASANIYYAWMAIKSYGNTPDDPGKDVYFEQRQGYAAGVIPSFSDKIIEFKRNCALAPTINAWAASSDPEFQNKNFKTPEDRAIHMKDLTTGYLLDYLIKFKHLPASVSIIGLSNADTLCTAETCVLPSGSTGGGGSTDPGSGGTTTPACTKPDGSTSGNPYDCSPQDNEFKCSIIDVPCALRKAFVPDKDFIKNKLENSSFGINVNLPVTVVQSWSVDIDVLGTKMPIKLDFSGLTLSEKTKDQFRFMIFWGTFLWLLHFLGVPFLGTRQSAGEAAKDSFNRVTAEAEHREQEAEAKYRALRADDSWKQP